MPAVRIWTGTEWQDLANQLQVAGPVVPLVTALPGSPVDGQEIYFQDAAMATDGVVWHLRYRVAAPGSFKWEFLGGSALHNLNGTSDSVTATTAVILPNTPLITVPLAGDYRAEWGSQMRHSAASQWIRTLLFKNSVSLGLDSAFLANSSGTPLAVNTSIGAMTEITGLAASDVIGVGSNVSAGTGTVGPKYLRLTPKRVGLTI